MEKTSIVIESDFEAATVEELNTLRQVRLGLAEAQFKNPEKVVDEMIRRGLISSMDRASNIKQLKDEIEKKLAVLRKRVEGEANVFYFDEIGLYSDLLVQGR